MSNIVRIKLALATVGLATWAWGTRIGDWRVQWLGIGFMAVAALMRFLRRPPSATE